MISPSLQCALVFTFCFACFRGHLKSISVPCFAGNSESSTTIFKAGLTLVQSAELSEIFIIDKMFLLFCLMYQYFVYEVLESFI